MKVVAMVTLLDAESYSTRGVMFRKNRPEPVTDRGLADSLADRPGQFLVQYVRNGAVPPGPSVPRGESEDRSEKRQVPGASGGVPGPAGPLSAIQDEDPPPGLTDDEDEDAGTFDAEPPKFGLNEILGRVGEGASGNG